MCTAFIIRSPKYLNYGLKTSGRVVRLAYLNINDTIVVDIDILRYRCCYHPNVIPPTMTKIDTKGGRFHMTCNISCAQIRTEYNIFLFWPFSSTGPNVAQWRDCPTVAYENKVCSCFSLNILIYTYIHTHIHYYVYVDIYTHI